MSKWLQINVLSSASWKKKRDFFKLLNSETSSYGLITMGRVGGGGQLRLIVQPFVVQTVTHFWRCLWKSHEVVCDTAENRTDYEIQDLVFHRGHVTTKAVTPLTPSLACPHPQLSHLYNKSVKQITLKVVVTLIFY